MKKLLLPVLILFTFQPLQIFSQQICDGKTKPYEYVVKQDVKEYAGIYKSDDSNSSIEIQFNAKNEMVITINEGNRKAVLGDIGLLDSKLTAFKTYSDGTRKRFRGRFANHIVNGEKVFGIAVDVFGAIVKGVWVDIDGFAVNREFYRLLPKTSSK